MQLSPQDQARARSLLERWSPDPATFAHEALGVDPWSRQRDIFATVAANRRVVTRSGHKLSKTNSIACLAWWWVCTRPRAKVVLSSTVGDQLRNILWPEVTRLHRESRAPLGGRLSSDYHGGWHAEDGRAIIALKSEDTKPEAFAGISSPHLLYLIDESSGFSGALLEAAWGNCASNGTIAAFSNPTRTSGWFYDAFHGQRAAWKQLHIDSRESPNITGECDVPGLARREWVDETIAAFGADSPTVAVRIGGNFPREGDCVVVGLGLLETVLARSVADASDGPLRLGLDVGRTGDDPSVLAAIRGQKAFPARELRKCEGDEVAGWVLAQLDDYQRQGLLKPGEKPECRIDIIGVGASVYDHLKHSDRLVAIPINVSTLPMNRERYATTRDELWFSGAAWMKEGGTLPPDPEEHGEYTAARYTFDGRGRYVVASKDDMKRTLKRSPNKADARNLAAYRGGPLPSHAPSYADARAGLRRGAVGSRHDDDD